MDQTEVQRLSQKIKSLEHKVNELETTTNRQSENKELLKRVGTCQNVLVPKDKYDLWCR